MGGEVGVGVGMRGVGGCLEWRCRIWGTGGDRVVVRRVGGGGGGVPATELVLGVQYITVQYSTFRQCSEVKKGAWPMG